MTLGSGNRRRPEGPVLAALLAGGLLGVAIALLLQAVSARTPTPLSPTRAFWQLGLFAFAGGLSGFALSMVRALQASNPNPDYHRARRPRAQRRYLRNRP
jgi:hypothetical protein